MSASRHPLVETFREYLRLYQLRNQSGGALEPEEAARWRMVSAELEAIFAGNYRTARAAEPGLDRANLRRELPVERLRVPTDADVLCELSGRVFTARLQDISTGGAYVHATAPFPPQGSLRLTFATFRDSVPLELEARIAWVNPGGARKRSLPEGAGVQFVNCDDPTRRRLQDFVYELVETALSRANLI
jgi:uncharacterized protein (TIGR02266 family)